MRLSMDIKNGAMTTLRQIGKDEKWLQDCLIEDPQRLGIGNITIKAKELRHYVGKGGRLDILAYNAASDTYYEVEIMLGECDSDHGFRVLDYWARERQRLPNCRHIAVLVAEDLSGRYKTVIEALTQYLPLIAVELKTLQLDTEPPVATTFAVVFSQPDNLEITPAGEPEKPEGLAPNDEETWRANKPEFTDAAKLMHKTCLD
jgi:hypothetical protein